MGCTLGFQAPAAHAQPLTAELCETEAAIKGVVYTALCEMVEEELGLEMWDRVITAVTPASGGAYTAAANYEDAELLAIVGFL